MINLTGDPFFENLDTTNIIMGSKADELLGFQKGRPHHASKKGGAPYLLPFPKIYSVT